MDAAGIDIQVLSLNAPGLEQTDAAEQIVLAAEANDFVAEAIKKHPQDFRLARAADSHPRQGR